MEIPGDAFKPYLGWVNQTTYAPVGRILPWKMTRITIDPTRDKVDTPTNAVPEFHTSINAKRISTFKMENACFDQTNNIFGLNDYSNLNGLGLTGGIAFALQEGMRFRMACKNNTYVPGTLNIGDFVGSPITGNVTELLPTGSLTSADWIFLACRVSKIHNMADAAAGQPFDFDFETVWPYAIPGEPWGRITAYGFQNVVGSGGFL